MAKAFKEWQVVCDALASGRQSLILRKGGIHEGREGFSFGAESFFLFPTRFHNQSQFVREGEVEPGPEWQVGDLVPIRHHGEALWARTLTDWDKVAALEPFHIWTEETIRQRFDWEGKGMSAGSIHVALVRVREMAAPWELVYESRHGGCRSWVEIGEPPAGWDGGGRFAMGDDAFATMADRIESILG